MATGHGDDVGWDDPDYDALTQPWRCGKRVHPKNKLLLQTIDGQLVIAVSVHMLKDAWRGPLFGYFPCSGGTSGVELGPQQPCQGGRIHDIIEDRTLPLTKRSAWMGPSGPHIFLCLQKEYEASQSIREQLTPAAVAYFADYLPTTCVQSALKLLHRV